MQKQNIASYKQYKHKPQSIKIEGTSLASR